MEHRGCKIGKFHTVRDWDLVMTGKLIAPPEPKLYTVEVEGGDGVIDRSTALTGGDIKYKNRLITINLEKLEQSGVLLPFLTSFLDEYQGQLVRVVFDEDPLFYYTGRAKVTYNQPNGYVLQLVMTIDAQPYKLKNIKTTSIKNIAGENVAISYRNLRKWVVPVFTTSAPITLKFEGKTYSLEKGSYTIPDIQFKRGENIIVYNGNATVQVSYQEGEL